MTGQIRRAAAIFGLAILACGAPLRATRGEDREPSLATLPVDDEPEGAAPAPVPAAPAAAPRPAYPAIALPVPPIRPWALADPATEGGARAFGAVQPQSRALVEPESGPRWPVFAEPKTGAPEIAAGAEGRIASLPATAEQSTTAEIESEEARTPEPNIAEKQTERVDVACLKPEVLEFVRIAGDHFGATPIITSGQRYRGRRGSYHRKCMAADFFVPGTERSVLAKYLRGLPGAGGVGTYCHTRAVHIDIGEPRNWYQCGRRFRFAQR